MSNDIYDIIRRLDESLNPQQKSVPQLPALFRPKSISVLGSKSDPQHPMKGYAVGTSESSEEPTAEAEVIPMKQGLVKFANKKDYLDKRDVIFRILSQSDLDPETKADLKQRLVDFEQAARSQGLINESDESNPMRRAVMHRIVNQHPEWITKYGAEALVQAIDDVTESDTDWEEIGSSDVSAYVNYVRDALRDRMGSREEMDDREPFAEVDANPTQTNTQQTQQPVQNQNNNDADMASKRLAMGTGQSGKTGILGKAVDAAVAGKALDPTQRQVIGQTMGAVQQAAAQDTRLQQLLKNATGQMAEDINESQATEDVISTVKRKLGDYLQDVATAIQKDPDLKDKIPQDIDQVKAVKTITTDDGHEIKIHGNEDDGFRISIKNKDIQRPFKTLDEATMACEMYCAKRRDDMLNADYVEER